MILLEIWTRAALGLFTVREDRPPSASPIVGPFHVGQRGCGFLRRAASLKLWLRCFGFDLAAWGSWGHERPASDEASHSKA